VPRLWTSYRPDSRRDQKGDELPPGFHASYLSPLLKVRVQVFRRHLHKTSADALPSGGQPSSRPCKYGSCSRCRPTTPTELSDSRSSTSVGLTLHARLPTKTFLASSGAGELKNRFCKEQHARHAFSSPSAFAPVRANCIAPTARIYLANLTFPAIP
jgi:hypothetical protein